MSKAEELKCDKCGSTKRVWTEKARKKCAYCGKEFFDKTNNRKYCSVVCRVGANIEMINKK